VQLACVCDGYRQEGGVIVPGRVIDILNVVVGLTGPNNELLPLPDGRLPGMLPSVEIPYTLLVSIKPDDYVGEDELRIVLVHPDGRREVGWSQRIQMGDTRGYHLGLRLAMRVGVPATFWFDVRFGRRLLTRVPFEVRYIPAGAAEREPHG
jgi:hypothetical protein